MNGILHIIIGCLLLAGTAAADEIRSFRSPMDAVNYGIGVEVIRNFKNQGVEIDLEMVSNGMKDALSDKIRIPEQELRRIMTSFQTELRQRKSTSSKLAAHDNNKKGDIFLAANKTKEGVHQLPSGLQYKIITAAEGTKPADTSIIEYHYRGTHLDGSEFANTFVTGKPVASKLTETVIPGLREALKLMSADSRWLIFVPPSLAYGEKGLSSIVSPNETLIFDVEIVAIR